MLLMPRRPTSPLPASIRARRTLALTAALLLCSAASATALTDASTEVLSTPGSVGLGMNLRLATSPYRDVGSTLDLIPLYLYEGERVFLRSSRIGLKLLTGPQHRFDVLVDKRLEGFPLKDRPGSLDGMDLRSSGTDAGLSYKYISSWGTLQLQALRDISSGHPGSEVRIGYGADWQSGLWQLRPSVTLAWRDSKLNDYYYGVRPHEATPGRPAYSAGAGINTTLGLDASYAVSRGWRLLGGMSVTLLPTGITDSPLVGRSVLPSVYVGAAYDFGAPTRPPFEAGSPTTIKALVGKSTEDGCHLVKILTARCFATSSTNATNIAGVQIGKPFIQNWNGWPIDWSAHLGLTQHDDRGLQRNGLQADAFLKATYSNFPWSQQVATRIGFGVGVSMAQRAPYIEASSQAQQGELSSRLLTYLDPTVDVSVGDLIGVRSLKNTFVGVGVSHRSGIFGSSRLLGKVDGGSNYIYTYLEAVF